MKMILLVLFILIYGECQALEVSAYGTAQKRHGEDDANAKLEARQHALKDAIFKGSVLLQANIEASWAIDHQLKLEGGLVLNNAFRIRKVREDACNAIGGNVHCLVHIEVEKVTEKNIDLAVLQGPCLDVPKLNDGEIYECHKSRKINEKKLGPYFQAIGEFEIVIFGCGRYHSHIRYKKSLHIVGLGRSQTEAIASLQQQEEHAFRHWTNSENRRVIIIREKTRFCPEGF